jgi:transcriptional regulator with XRE-family HTH domain
MTMSAPRLVSDQVAERHWVCARRLRERRMQLALTQAELVNRLARRGVILTNRTVSAMENGRGLDLGRVPDLAAVLTCSVTYLLGLTDDPHRWEPDVPLTPDPAGQQGEPTVAVPAGAAPQPPAGGFADRDRETRRTWILGPEPPPDRAAPGSP